jgi:hypothetical protein
MNYSQVPIFSNNKNIKRESSFAEEIHFLNSPIVPSATGDVKIKTDSDHNYVIQISISNLPEVTKLQPEKQTYVVWMVTDEDTIKNIAQINSSTHYLSSFETVSSFKPAKIFITAEDDANIQYPGTQVVLSTISF